MKRILFIINLLALCSLAALAQQESRDVRKGNRQYKKENYTEAEVDYRRGLEKNNKSFEAHFNLGDALFKQDKYQEAAEQFGLAAQQLDAKKDKDRLAATYHNLGNSYFGAQQYDQAVKAYQQALRNNPKDNDTRYNLVKAMQMLQQQQNQNQNQDQNQQQQQQQQQQNQDQNENQNENQQQQQQQDQNQMDKETAEQILQALEQDEQDTQEKLQRQQGSKKRAEKDW